MSAPELFQIEHDNVRMHGLVQGKGEPVLLVHGVPSSLGLWALTKDRIASRHQVIAMDLPGFGQSTKVALPSLDAFTEWLARLLDHLHVPSAHVVAHSFGGMICLAFLARYPQRVRSLVLSDSVGLGPYTGGEFQQRIAAARTRDEIRSALRLNFHDPAFIVDPIVEGYFAYLNQPGVPGLLAELNAHRSAWEASVAAHLDTIKLPLLLMWGRNDRSVPVGNAERLRRVPGVRTVIFDDCGHAPMVEKAQEFVAHLLDFLDEVVQRRGRN